MKVWFQNRRIKWRKHHLEITQQRLAIIRQRQMPVTVNSNTENRMVGNDKSTTALTASPALTDFENASAAIDTSATMDSELSICSDSMDSNSKHDVEDL